MWRGITSARVSLVPPLFIFPSSFLSPYSNLTFLFPLSLAVIRLDSLQPSALPHSPHPATLPLAIPSRSRPLRQRFPSPRLAQAQQPRTQHDFTTDGLPAHQSCLPRVRRRRNGDGSGCGRDWRRGRGRSWVFFFCRLLGFVSSCFTFLPVSLLFVPASLMLLF